MVQRAICVVGAVLCVLGALETAGAELTAECRVYVGGVNDGYNEDCFGVYEYVDDPTRPYYMLADPDKLTTEDKFLYEDENLQYWVIGPVVGPTNGYWFSPRVSSNPAESTQWHVNTGTGFILQPRVKATAACPTPAPTAEPTTTYKPTYTKMPTIEDDSEEEETDLGIITLILTPIILCCGFWSGFWGFRLTCAKMGGDASVAPVKTVEFNHGIFQPPRFFCVELDLNEKLGWTTTPFPMRVTGVDEGSQAATGGVKPGWTVCSVNGQGINDLNMFNHFVEQVKASGETKCRFHLDTATAPPDAPPGPDK